MIGENLKKIRLENKLGINELSRISGVNASYISAIERGVKNNPSQDILKKLGNALNVSVDEFFKEDEEIKKEKIKELVNKEITSVEDALEIIRFQDGLMFNGEVLTDEDKLLLANALQLGMKYVLEKKKESK
ncbi:MAG: helix-turn-helix transcriptional regulator [Tissierellaceae bacterium]